MTPTQILFACFLFALGACIGSFLNVVIWRLPHRGHEVTYLKKTGKLTLSWPPSHCPVCDAPIQWYHNIPILSWFTLGARCANCRTTIPIRYPLVELATASLFLAFYLAYFIAHWTPGFDDLMLQQGPQWPAFALHLVLIAALLAAAAIDIDWFIIPLSIPYILVVLGLAAAPFIDHPVIPRLHPDFWVLAKPTLGCAAGVLLANLLLRLGILKQSFANLESDAPLPLSADSKVPPTPSNAAPGTAEAQERIAPLPKLSRTLPSTLAVVTLLIVAIACWFFISPLAAALVAVCAAILIFLIGVLPRDDGQTDVTDEVLEEISVPHARREILRELIFLLIPIACGVIAWCLPGALPEHPWLARLTGSLLGLLAGGGVVWMIRVGGTLALGKEAMGLGDVHLMTGIGAVVGAPLVLMAFIAAACLGAVWGILLKLFSKPSILPYGPWLAIASILCLLIGKPILAWYMTFFLMGAPPPAFPPPAPIPAPAPAPAPVPAPMQAPAPHAILVLRVIEFT